jgi:hypothetical protein
MTMNRMSPRKHAFEKDEETDGDEPSYINMKGDLNNTRYLKKSSAEAKPAKRDNYARENTMFRS